MRSAIVSTLALSTSASAAMLFNQDAHWSDGTCSFTLTAHGPGSANGPIGQLDDGQNRVGGGHPAGTFHLRRPTDGGVIDAKGRGCILTYSTKQWQCDQGVNAHPGFDVSCDGTFTFNNNPKFYACPVNDHGEWNVYTRPVTGQKKCIEIKLTASGNCALPCDKPSPPSKKNTCEDKTKDNGKCVAPSPTPPKPACDQNTESKCTSPGPPAPAKPFCHNGTNENGKLNDLCAEGDHCPADLQGGFEFPHLIVPLSLEYPDKTFGNALNGTLNWTTCTAYNFDINPDHAGKKCSLIFLFPEHKDLQTSSYTLKGQGSLIFNKLVTPVDLRSTWNNKGPWQRLHTESIWPNKSIVAWSGICEASQKAGYEICTDGNIELEYFQDYNPSPIGLYMRVC